MNWILLLLILALCPLMHFWMMRKGGHKHGGDPSEEKTEDKNKKKLLSLKIRGGERK